jgi:hypothetical protein
LGSLGNLGSLGSLGSLGNLGNLGSLGKMTIPAVFWAKIASAYRISRIWRFFQLRAIVALPEFGAFFSNRHASGVSQNLACFSDRRASGVGQNLARFFRSPRDQSRPEFGAFFQASARVKSLRIWRVFRITST